MPQAKLSQSVHGKILSTQRVAQQTLEILVSNYPNATTELIFKNPYQLLVSTILSAQSTDKRVNHVTPKLFEQFPDPSALAVADAPRLQALIRSTGCFRIKARSLILMAIALVQNHGGAVPNSMESLTALPGVGRKTANVLLGHAFNGLGFPVDRHVLRVSNRLGLVQTENPTGAELLLKKIFLQSAWTHVSDVLIQHGRKICKPRPHCDKCSVRRHCKYQIQYAPPVRNGLTRKNKLY